MSVRANVLLELHLSAGAGSSRGRQGHLVLCQHLRSDTDGLQQEPSHPPPTSSMTAATELAEGG